MADPSKVREIIDAVSIPVMAKVRIGHFVEAQVLESLGVDMIDESEVLTPADEKYHINKKEFTIPFVCGARNLGEALRRIDEGAAMIRTKGEAGTGNIVEAVRHSRQILGTIRELRDKTEEELWNVAREIESPLELVKETARLGRLPVVNLCSRWSCYTCRRSTHDAARFGWSVCWFRHIQIRTTRTRCKGHC